VGLASRTTGNEPSNEDGQQQKGLVQGFAVFDRMKEALGLKRLWHEGIRKQAQVPSRRKEAVFGAGHPSAQIFWIVSKADPDNKRTQARMFPGGASRSREIFS
jgi:hypothetical protein